MAVKFKAKQQEETKQSAKTTTDFGIEEKVDEIGALNDELAKLKKSKTALRMNELSKSISKKQGECAEAVREMGLDVDAKLEVEGEHYRGVFGPEGKSRSFLPGANKLMIDSMGEDQFLELASIKLGDIDKYLTPPEIAKVLKTERTGSRSLKVEPRA